MYMYVSFFYSFLANKALDKVLAALLKMDPSLLLAALKSPHLGLKNVVDANIEFYVQKLQELQDIKKASF